MDHMRFNHSPNREEAKYEEPNRSTLRPRLKGILIVLLVVALISGILFGVWSMYQKKSTFVVYDVTASPYYAVFLTNGQVYFGKPVSKSRSEFILSDVYYLQASANSTQINAGQSSEQRFALVKLGQEVHGPTDRLFINTQNVLFYEQLSKDSKVVASINEKQ